MNSIVVYGAWTPDFFARLSTLCDEVHPLPPGAPCPADVSRRARILITTSDRAINETTMAAYPDVRFHFRAASGDENVDISYLSARGVRHAHFPEPFADSTAQHTLALILACVHNLPWGQHVVFGGRWERPVDVFRELAVLRVGLVGFGHVGSRLYRALTALGARVSVSDPFRESELFERPLPADAVPASWEISENQWPELDLIALCVRPRSDAARAAMPVLSSARMQTLKRGVRVVNTSRAYAIDEAAFKAGLSAGAIGPSAMDVLWEEPLPTGHWLYDFQDRVMITPHIASRTAASRAGMERALLAAVAAAVEGR